jgi:hypothetical protein
MKPRTIKQREQSISLDIAAEILGILPEELQLFCDQDTEYRYHHQTIFSKRVRLFPVNLKAIRKKLEKYPYRGSSGLKN